MKPHHLTIGFLLLFLTACTVRSSQQEQTPFEQVCRSNSHSWMKMSETKDGVIVGPACDGCMPDRKNHLCNQQEYEEYAKK